MAALPSQSEPCAARPTPAWAAARPGLRCVPALAAVAAAELPAAALALLAESAAALQPVVAPSFEPELAWDALGAVLPRRSLSDARCHPPVSQPPTEQEW